MRGLPTNFLVFAPEQLQSGLLLGFPAEVRFSPVGYRWDYGDGGRTDTSVAGTSWASQGLPEFSETGTSHAFRAPGAFNITLTVVYAADYRFAGLPWRAVQGTLAVEADPLSVIVGDATTVLVNRECTAQRASPGC